MLNRNISPYSAVLLLMLAAIFCLPSWEARGDDSKPHDYTNLDANYQRLLAFKPKKDPKTGFVVGGMNSTETIRGLQEINGIKIADLETSMRPGKLSKTGFLGDKERLLEIMAADNDWVVKTRLTHQEIARHLRVLAVVSRGESEPFIYHGTRLRAKIFQYDGFQDSPFKDGTKASDDVALENLDNGEWIRYSLLVPMMVERYGFYEGKGTSYRVEPKSIVKVLSFLKTSVDEEKKQSAVGQPPVARGEQATSVGKSPPSVYAKIILSIKSPAKGEHPAVESWLARELRKRGLTEFRAVTDWVKLAEGEEKNADIWSATVDGEPWGCPVSGWVSERTVDGKVKVELSGWSPVAVAKIKGNTLAAKTGSRAIATVDTGIDQDGRAFVALVIGSKATHDHGKGHSATRSENEDFSQQPISKGEWTYKNGKPESVTFDYGTELTVMDIDRLSSCTSITRIVMGYAGVDSEYVTIEGDLLKLRRLRNLEEVHLCKDGIDDDDLKFIALLPKLHTLEFNADNGYDSAPICTDRCADHLRSAKALRSLVIHDGQFTDKFVAKITQDLANLEVLSLNSAELTDESLRLLATRCKNLKSLSIASEHFTAKGLKHLDNLKNLEDRAVSSPALREMNNPKEVLKLLGTWEYVSVTYEGKPFDFGKSRTITLTEDSWTLRRNGKVISSSTWEIDSTRSPKWLTQLTKGGKVNFLSNWVYRFDEEKLVLCESAWVDGPRPKEFTSRVGEKQYLIVLRRQTQK